MGSNTDISLLQTIIVGIINLTFTVLAIFTVDKYGRKPLMVIGALGMAVSMLALGFTFYFENIGIAALLFMLTYVASFAMSWGPVTWFCCPKYSRIVSVDAQWLWLWLHNGYRIIWSPGHSP